MQVFYRPPPKSKPLEVEGLGGVYIFYPPDQIWRKTTRQHKIRPIMDPILKDFVKNEDGTLKYLMGSVKDWEVDEEKTKLLKANKMLPPSDSYEIPEELWRLMNQGKSAATRKWFVLKSDMDKKFEADYAALKKQGEERLAKLRADIDERESKLMAELAATETKASPRAK